MKTASSGKKMWLWQRKALSAEECVKLGLQPVIKVFYPTLSDLCQKQSGQR